MSEDKCGAETRDGSPCQNAPIQGRERCRHHGGKTPSKDENPDVGAPERNDNAATHGLHVSAETFFANADQHHLDTYYAVHEALCTRFEQAHGREPMYHDKKELAQVALSIAKLDMADEYAAENAVDESKPLTEEEKNMGESGPWYREVVSKIEALKTDIRRENRLLLKDKGIYASPEAQAAEAEASIAEMWRKQKQD